jgi:hypothetical protein
MSREPEEAEQFWRLIRDIAFAQEQLCDLEANAAERHVKDGRKMDADCDEVCNALQQELERLAQELWPLLRGSYDLVNVIGLARCTDLSEMKCFIKQDRR